MRYFLAIGCLLAIISSAVAWTHGDPFAGAPKNLLVNTGVTFLVQTGSKLRVQ